MRIWVRDLSSRVAQVDAEMVYTEKSTWSSEPLPRTLRKFVVFRTAPIQYQEVLGFSSTPWGLHDKERSNERYAK